MHKDADIALIRSAWISFAVSIVVLAIKTAGYFATHSESVLSDAVESVVNVVAALVALLVMRAVAEPADDEHPYGHGKLEFFSAAFEGGFVAFAALAIAVSAVRTLISGNHITSFEAGFWSMGVASVINLLLSLHLFRVGRKHQSEALLASAKHVMSDVVTTGAVLIGLGLVKLSGWLWMDAGLALLVAIHLFREGAMIVRHAAGALIDETDPYLVEEVAAAFAAARTPEFIDIHNLKLMRSGRFHHIDAHLVLPQYWDILQAHQRTSEFERQVLQKYPYEGEITFHMDPCKQKFCKTCATQDCPIRLHPLVQERTFAPGNLVKNVLSDEDVLR